MDSQFSNPDSKDFQYTKRQDGSNIAGSGRDISSQRNEDLIIEDNTVYEIDRECYERLNNKKRRK